MPFDKKARVKVIPSGGYLVPEIKVGTGESALIVSDSEKILHWIDDTYEAGLYPNELASQLSVRASDTKLAGFVWYYNWVDPKSFQNSILKAVRSMVPWWLSPIVPDFILAMPLKSEKEKFRRQACRAIGVPDKELDDEPHMRKILIEELTFFQSQLKEASQLYLVPGTSEPTAADVSVYPQLERLVGGNGAYDVEISAAVPELKEIDSLQRLWDWHKRMQETCPVQFRGKKPPKELL